MRQVEQFGLDAIASLPGRRPVNREGVDRLAESLKSMGLRTPITVRLVDDFLDDDGVLVDGQPVLVTGAHRLAAAKQLGWDKIECFVFEGDDEIDAKLWEIAENLHRAELSTMERSEQIAEWVRLMDEKQAKEVSAQVAPKPQGGRPEGGVRAAARDLNINRDKARRATKIASISDEAKAKAAEYGIETQTALERIAKADDQLGEIDRIEDERVERERKKAERKAQKKKSPPQPDPDPNASDPSMSAKEQSDYMALCAAWNRCSEAAQRDFILERGEFVGQVLSENGGA